VLYSDRCRSWKLGVGPFAGAENVAERGPRMLGAEVNPKLKRLGAGVLCGLGKVAVHLSLACVWGLITER
jgi:hypothetical protein